MKVLLDYLSTPFFLAHGGATTQILETAKGLNKAGARADFVNWWDPSITADIVHTFGTPPKSYIHFAKAKKVRFVNTTLFTAQCNRPSWQLGMQGSIKSLVLKSPGLPVWNSIRSQMQFDSFRECDLNVVGLMAEVDVLRKAYSVDPSRIAVVPLGLDDAFLHAGHGSREHDELITTGTITPRKRSVELAEMAIAARVPIRFVGKPYDVTDAYWKKFESLIDDRYVRYTSHTESVAEMIQLLKRSRGFVLHSDYEHWCLSAHEAIACGIPILVPDQRWSRERFGNQASYLTPGRSEENVARLKHFHETCPGAPAPDVTLHSWTAVGKLLIEQYSKLLS